MNNKEINNSKKGFSKGYAIRNKVIQDNQLEKKFKKLDKQYTDKSYPNGVIPFICLLLFYLIFTIVVISIGFSQKKDIFIYQWYWSTLSVASCYLLMNLLWLVGRSGFASTIGFSMLKVSRLIRLNKLRQKIEYYRDEPALNDVKNIQDFNEFCLERKKYTKKFCYISLVTSSSIFAINMIVSFCYYYIVVV